MWWEGVRGGAGGASSEQIMLQRHEEHMVHSLSLDSSCAVQRESSRSRISSLSVKDKNSQQHKIIGGFILYIYI